MGSVSEIMQTGCLLGGGVLIGLGAGALTGLFGAGGGFIVTPALNVFLGLPYNFAVGTSTCQILGASIFALRHHVDRQWLGIRVAWLTGIGVPLGSLLGVRTVNRLRDMGDMRVAGRVVAGQEFFFTAFFCVFLALIAAWMLYDCFFLRRRHVDDTLHRGYLAGVRVPPLIRFRTIPGGPFSASVLVVLGTLLGFLGGLLGIGGGVIMMPMLFYLVGQKTKFAALTSTMLVFATSLFSCVLHARHGNIQYSLAAVLICGAFAGTRIGAAWQRRLTGKSIRTSFAFVVLAAVAMVLFKLASILSRGAPADPAWGG